MQDAPFNIIHFANEQYTQSAPLSITPKPDAILRLFMVVKPLEQKVNIKEQNFPSFERKGFTVVEWGGTIVKS